jgi:hypothetical protein
MQCRHATRRAVCRTFARCVACHVMCVRGTGTRRPTAWHCGHQPSVANTAQRTPCQAPPQHTTCNASLTRSASRGAGTKPLALRRPASLPCGLVRGSDGRASALGARTASRRGRARSRRFLGCGLSAAAQLARGLVRCPYGRTHAPNHCLSDRYTAGTRGTGVLPHSPAFALSPKSSRQVSAAVGLSTRPVCSSSRNGGLPADFV